MPEMAKDAAGTKRDLHSLQKTKALVALIPTHYLYFQIAT